jgi:hypothetical protein
MKKLATMPMDIVDELLQEDLDSLLELVDDLPESVKTAHIPTTAEVDETAEDNFALVMYHPELGFIKKFANYNQDLTTLNTKLFIKNEALLPKEMCDVIGKNLYRAHVQFKADIPSDLDKYASEEYVPNVVQLTSINRIDYADKLSVVDEPLEKVAYALPIDEKFPIHDEYHVKRAMEFFDANSSALAVPSRIIYAANVLASTDTPTEKIEKYASLNTEEFNELFDVHLSSRKRFMKEGDLKYLAGLSEKVAELTPMQACLYLEEIDNTFGLNRLYGKHIDDAPLSTFAINKEASVKLHNGDELTSSSLDAILGNEKIAEYVSDELLRALNTDNGLKVFSLMPSELQDLLRGLE